MWVRKTTFVAALSTNMHPKLFLGSGLGFLLYGLVFLNMRGNVTTSGIHFRRDSRIVKMIDEDSVAIARQMLIYPVSHKLLLGHYPFECVTRHRSPSLFSYSPMQSCVSWLGLGLLYQMP